MQKAAKKPDAKERGRKHPDVDRRDTVFADGGAMIQSMSEEETLSIKKQIVNVLDQLAEMEPVAVITYNLFNVRPTSRIVDIIDKEYNQFGHRVDRLNYGIVLLERNQINKAVGYLNTPGEYAALFAVPRVIKRGLIADQHEDHKGRKIESITFAAPAIINGKRGNVGVVVQRIEGTSRYKTHRILMPDGTAFEINEADSTTGAGVNSLESSDGSPIKSASVEYDTTLPGESQEEKSDIRHSYDDVKDDEGDAMIDRWRSETQKNLYIRAKMRYNGENTSEREVTMTEKLYYADAYLAEFTANVVSCVPDGDRFRVILDRTAFYPEGGGERADTGTIGAAAVLDVQKDGGEVVHFTDRALSGEVECAVDFAPRYRMMQNHTAEHIACGVFHRLVGAQNVGFHMGAKDVTFDLDVEPDGETIARAEYLVNEAVFQNVAVSSSFPTADELSRLEYRSKLDFPDGAAVRIVTIDGWDACACSALHVRRTGEIGRVKFISHARYKGGVRIHMLAGYDALEYDLAEHAAVCDVAERLSAKPEELSEAVALLEAKIAAAKEERRRLVERYADAAVREAIASRAAGGAVDGESGKSCVAIGEDALLVDDLLSPDELRALANRGAGVFRHAVAVNEASGNFVITAGDGGDAKAFLAALKEKIALSGGGKSDMVSGRLGCEVDALAVAIGEIAAGI